METNIFYKSHSVKISQTRQIYNLFQDLWNWFIIFGCKPCYKTFVPQVKTTDVRTDGLRSVDIVVAQAGSGKLDFWQP